MAIAALLTGTLLWLGWQLSQQDRELASQRAQERGDNAADLSVAALQKSLSQAEEQLTHMATLPLSELRGEASRAAASLGGDSVFVVAHKAGLEVFPEKRLPFQPDGAAASAAPPALFAEADAFEFRKQDYRSAILTVEHLLSSSNPTVRASALMRLGRLNRKQEKWNEALAAYEEMLALAGAMVEDLPAELVARQARLRVFEERGMNESARHEAAALASLMEARKWRLNRGAYEFFRSETSRILGPASGPAGTDATFAMAAAVASLHEFWQENKEPIGRRLFRDSGGWSLALWRESGDAKVAFLVGPVWLDSALQKVLSRREMSLSLTDAEGHTVLGELPAGTPRQSVRLASVTQLPWNVHVVAGNVTAEKWMNLRRRLLATALGIITLFILAGGYLITRAVTRELTVSRLQSDFVSAVSHEFRTPLTTLCLLSGQLAKGKIDKAGDQSEYFNVLSNESQRLRRLVEGLLNFGRMEAGAAQYRFETIDPAELVQQVTDDFSREGERHPIEVHAQADAPLVRADRAALACALWNLLDNAAKYSAGSALIEVDVERVDNRAAIRVRDRGQGIPAPEQERIFHKFVRGEAAIQAGIRGTGLGLAMVRHIVAAHHGEIELRSDPGKGTVFTLLLPAVG
ncbi:MAG: HAMP domain-containing histidine kinase [Acidobacteria bacterium]|nr:HAMP domain-containing histidine kinase [Acidobacteriota bacterium]